MLPLQHATDVNTRDAGLRNGSDSIQNFVLTANVESHYTIPAGAQKVVIMADTNIYVKIGASSVSAAVPSVDVTDGSGSELDPAGFLIRSTDVRISIMSSAAAKGSLAFYS